MRSLNQALPRETAADADQRDRLCPAGEVANSFLDHASSPDDRGRRCRRLIAWGGRRYFGLSLEDIASALGVSAQFVSRDTMGVREQLRLEAARLSFTEEQCGLERTHRETAADADGGGV